MLKGNKGEWSELYAFLKLLADGKLFSADEHLNKTQAFVQILSILRNDSGNKLAYDIKNSEVIHVLNEESEEKVLSFSRQDAENIATDLITELRRTNDISIELSQSIKNLLITKVSDKTPGKGDIFIKIFDPLHGISSLQEFSIKSFLGSKPTLFNANKTTNITYEITDNGGYPMSEDDLTQVNNIDTRHKYLDRVSKITELGYNIIFDSYDDNTFKLNLQVIDSDLPLILAQIVKDKYTKSLINITDVIDNLNDSNPMNYDLSQGHKFYEYRIVNFLVEAALGMTSKSVWSGKYDVVGGIIIIKPDAEILCYHLIDFNKFKQYLKNSAKLDNPSGSRMGYGSVYREGNATFIKLNFQIKA
jgi:hypothetical protein